MLSTIGSVASQGGGTAVFHFDWNSSTTYDKATGTHYTLENNVDPSYIGYSLTTGKFGTALNIKPLTGATIMYQNNVMNKVYNKNFTFKVWLKAKTSIGGSSGVDQYLFSSQNSSVSGSAGGFCVTYIPGNRNFRIKINEVYSNYFTFPEDTWTFLKVAVTNNLCVILLDGVVLASMTTVGYAYSTYNAFCIYGGYATNVTLDECILITDVFDTDTSVPTAPF